MYIRRLSCLRERTIKFRIYSQLRYFQQGFKLDLITGSGFFSNSHQVLNHFDYNIKLTSAKGLKG